MVVAVVTTAAGIIITAAAATADSCVFVRAFFPVRKITHEPLHLA